MYLKTAVGRKLIFLPPTTVLQNILSVLIYWIIQQGNLCSAESYFGGGVCPSSPPVGGAS